VLQGRKERGVESQREKGRDLQYVRGYRRRVKERRKAEIKCA
jgi:hypothetical protein